MKVTMLLAILIVTGSASALAEEYIGNKSSNPYNANSTANPYGAGSRYNANSVNNPNGQYGSRYSSKSANKT